MYLVHEWNKKKLETHIFWFFCVVSNPPIRLKHVGETRRTWMLSLYELFLEKNSDWCFDAIRIRVISSGKYQAYLTCRDKVHFSQIW